jgi:lysophospholipase L1-like esterase
MGYHRFVALGDSCTEGLDDPHPQNGQYRGWADFVAGRLALDEPDFRYANLGVRGKRLHQIITEQMPRAEALAPDVIALFGGGNDVMHRRWEARTVARQVDVAVRTATSIAPNVVVYTLSDVASRMPLGERMRPRIEDLNGAIRESAVSYGALLVELWLECSVTDSRYFGADRLHLSELGHRRLAAHTLRKLDVSFAPSWLEPLPGTPVRPGLRDNAAWVCKRVVPLVGRRIRDRITGTEPGTGRLPRRPELLPVLATERTQPLDVAFSELHLD